MNQDQLGIVTKNRKVSEKTFKKVWRSRVLIFLLIAFFSVAVFMPFSYGVKTANAQYERYNNNTNTIIQYDSNGNQTGTRSVAPSDYSGGSIRPVYLENPANIPSNSPAPYVPYTPFTDEFGGLENNTGGFTLPESLTGAAGTQGGQAVTGEQGTGGANPLAGLAGAAGGAAECLGISQSIRLAMQTVMSTAAENFYKVGTTDGNQHTRTGTDGKLGFDAVAYCLVNAFLDYMIKSMTAWVNSGFDGNPTFITDLGQYVKDAGNQVLAQELGNIDQRLDQNGIPAEMRGALKSAIGQGFTGNSGSGGFGDGSFISKLGGDPMKYARTYAETQIGKQISSAMRKTSNTKSAEATLETQIPNMKPGEEKEAVDENGNVIKRATPAKITKPTYLTKSENQELQNSPIKQMIDTDQLERSLQQLLKALLNQLFNKFGEAIAA